MRFPRLLNPISLAARRRLALVALVAYLGTALGLPVPASWSAVPPAKSGAQAGAFPCAGHGCGCATASHCWDQCCCMTPRERLAWARRHGVSPPAALVALSSAGHQAAVAQAAVAHCIEPAGAVAETAAVCADSPAAPDAIAQLTSCCEAQSAADHATQSAQGQPADSCHAHDSSEHDDHCAADAHCSAGAGRSSQPPAASEAADSSSPETSIYWVLGPSSQRCRGLSAMGPGGPPSLPPEPQGQFALLELRAAGVAIVSDRLPRLALAPPPSPPPEA